ncbi:MAG: hypothetical protein IPN90_03760 [Elusimicrobia bacterium]|nr:hypothetical protein [Elusimicrobiota bacterium]
MDNLRFKIRVGEREFEAEGPREAVEARWAEAKDWLLNTPAAKTHSVEVSQNLPNQEENPIFEVDRGRRTVRLRVLPPRGEVLQRLSNALLLLLYGYNDLLSRPGVPVTRMAEDLRMSGFAGLKRLSRAFLRLETEGLAARNGSGKGTNYRATNPGLTAARTLAKSLSK